jgi:NTE family protein
MLEFIDFDAIRRTDAFRLFIAATDVETGDARIFTGAELSPEVLLASACLPSVHQAVKIDGRYYWDGGFTANPPLMPLIEGCAANDVVIVRLNPTREEGVPVTAPKIQTRVNRIVFDAALKRELELIERLRRITVEAGAQRSALGRRLAGLQLHVIGEDGLMNEIGGASKIHPDWRLVHYLREQGYTACARWLSDGARARPQWSALPVLGQFAAARAAQALL